MADDPDAVESPEATLASTRSRRGPSTKKSRREEALAKLKARKNREERYEVSGEMTDNVYDIVDEKKYAERVKERLQDDFIVDDDGEYADDGREIFEEDENDDVDRSGPRKKASKKKEAEKKEAKKRGNIKNMLLNMPGKRSGAGDKGEGGGLKDDQLLESLLGEIKTSKPVLKRPRTGAPVPSVREPSRPSAGQRRQIAPARVDITRPIVSSSSSTPSQVIEEEHSEAMDVGGEEEEGKVDEAIEDLDDVEQEDVDVQVPSEEAAVKEEKVDNDTIAHLFDGDNPWEEDEEESSLNLEGQSSMKTLSIEHGSIPTVTDAEGQKVLRMYWLDAFEDGFKHPGTVWLFGKVLVEEAGTFVSCCVTVKNIPKQVFLLKRENRFDPKVSKEVKEEEVTMDDVYQEFNSKVAMRFKIPEFRSKTSEKLYAFEHVDVPAKAEYLEVQYAPRYQALPTDLRGETFSHVFGANRSSLEQLLLSRKMKGPGWIDIAQPASSPAPISHCKVEAICEVPSRLRVVPPSEAPQPPPLTVMALNMRTVIHPKTMLNEVVLVSCLVHDEFYLDRPAPEKPFKSHFCALSKPESGCWPFDFQKMLDAYKKKKGSPRIDRMDSERALLGFVLAHVQRLDPDIIIGHDISGFDLEVLLHRTVTNKIPRWSRLGRLNRTQPPNFHRRHAAERQAMAGRLICDLKISAKELIRCKSYELAALAEKLLGEKRASFRMQSGPSASGLSGPDEVAAAYDSSRTLMAVVKSSLADAADTLQVTSF